jgi:hypothetical protein
MTTKNELPTLETLLGAEKVEELKNDIKKVSQESYQPLLDKLGERLQFSHTKAEVTAEVTLTFVEEDGHPVVGNHVSLDIVFTPAHTHDPFEKANRLILRELFGRTLKK